MRIKRLESIVHETLRKYEKTRNDDFVLIAYVYDKLCPEIRNYGFNNVMLEHSNLNLPSMESITRARRKLQAMYQNLKASEYVENKRKEKEEEFKDYVKEREEIC